MVLICKLNAHHTRMLLPCLSEIGPLVLNSPSMYFRYNLPLDDSSQAWMKLAQWFLRRRFWKLVNVFSRFRYYLPLEKGRAIHLYKFQFPSPKAALCQVWLKLAQWFWRKRWKCEKCMTTTTTDNKQISIRKTLISLWLRWAKKHL